MALTCAMVYLCCGLVTTAVTFLVSRRMAVTGMSSLQTLGFSILGGAVWPMLVVGVVEFSSVAAYSTANSMRDTTVPDSWLGDGMGLGVVIPLR